MTTPRQLQERYLQGENIEAFLRDETGVSYNTPELIEASYDLQTGKYIAAMQDDAVRSTKSEYSKAIATTIASLCTASTVMEAGVGEATTFSGVLRELGDTIDGYGFDLSWSRVAYGLRWLSREGVRARLLCTGSLFDIPFADSSIDVVYTSHSVEPNGSREEQILRELYRVARGFVILLEPAYELAGDEARRRMERLRYCRDLPGTAERLGFRVVDHRLFPFSANPMNPTAITVIRKDHGSVAPEAPADVLACPRYKTPLERIGGMLFSPEALSVYPVVCGIPCLKIENAIRASTYPEIVSRVSSLVETDRA